MKQRFPKISFKVKLHGSNIIPNSWHFYNKGSFKINTFYNKEIIILNIAISKTTVVFLGNSSKLQTTYLVFPIMHREMSGVSLYNFFISGFCFLFCLRRVEFVKNCLISYDLFSIGWMFYDNKYHFLNNKSYKRKTK